MTAKEYTSDRKRSRPVTKKSKTDVMKKNWILTSFIIMIIMIAIVAGAVFILSNKEETSDDNGNGKGSSSEELNVKNDEYYILKNSANNDFNVLLNDEDANKSSLQIINIGVPSFGEAKIVENQIVYTPDDSFDNQDSFSYTVLNEKNVTASANVTVKEYPNAIINTNMGTITVGLYIDKVPNTCENFIRLANNGFYNGLVFHRVIDDFMIQGGGFETDGAQKESPYGTIDLEIHEDVLHIDGTISMARTSDPNSATSQFFICDGAQQNLDDDFLQENYGQRGYAAFGIVVEGIDVLRTIASVETTTKNGMTDWPVEEVIINSMTIENY